MRLFYLLFSLGILGAQAPVDTAVHSVSYVEVMPSSRAIAVAALKQYRNLSSKDGGFVRVEIFEQVGVPGHFSIVETWADQKSFEAHRMAALTTGMLGKLDSIRTSDYDLRPYKSLTVGSARAANNNAIYIVAHIDEAGGQAKAPVLLRQLAEASRNDDGNLRFDVLQHAMRPNHFTVVEAWQSQKALDSHAAAEHTKQYRNALAPITGSPIDQRLYKVVD